MYLSDTDIYTKAFAAIKKVANEEAEYDADIYTKIAKIKGMVELTEEILKGEEK